MRSRSLVLVAALLTGCLGPEPVPPDGLRARAVAERVLAQDTFSSAGGGFASRAALVLEDGSFGLLGASVGTFETVGFGRGVRDEPRRAARLVEGEVEIERAGALERITALDGAVAQSWWMDEPPAGEGDLVVRVRAHDAVALAEDAGGVVLDVAGARVRYGSGALLDSAGSRTPIAARWVDGAIELRVPASVLDSARFPAVLDPVVGPEIAVGSRLPDEAWGDSPRLAGHGTGFVALVRDALIDATYAVELSATGTVVPPGARLLSLGGERGPPVATAWNGTTHLVLLRSAGGGLGAALMSASGELDASSAATLSSGPISVAAVASDGDGFFAVWSRETGTGEALEGARISATGAVLASPITLRSASSEEYPSVALAWTGAHYLLVAGRTGLGPPNHVIALRIAANGSLLDADPRVLGTTETAQVLASAGPSETLVSWDSRAALVGLDGTARMGSRIGLDSTDRVLALARTAGAWIAIVSRLSGNTLVRRLGDDEESSSSALLPIATREADVECTPTECVALCGSTPLIAQPDLSTLRFDSDLSAIDAAVEVRARAPEQSGPRVAFGDGVGWVAWGEPWGAAFAARLDPRGGMTEGPELSLGRIGDHGIAVGGGVVLVAWGAPLGLTADSDVEYRARRFDARDGSPLGPSISLWVTRGAGSATRARVAWAGDRFVVVGVGTGVRARAVLADGTVLWPSATAIPSAAYELALSPGPGPTLAVLRGLDSVVAIPIHADGTLGTATSIRSGITSSQVAATWNGTHHVVAWRERVSGAWRTAGQRLTSDGALVDASPTAIREFLVADPLLASNGTDTLLVYQDDRDRIVGLRIGPDLAPLDATPFELDAGIGLGPATSPTLAAAGERFLLGYVRLDPSPGIVRKRVHVRYLTAAPAETCSTAAECTTGHCVDGVCCDSACGDGAADCQACSVAAGGAVDGTCGPLASTIASTAVCRPAAGPCDAAERCTADSTECPSDVLVEGVECRPSAGPCDVAESCDGVSVECPQDAFAPATTECRAAAGLCDVPEACTGTGAECPADVVVPAGHPCRAAAGACDVAESCDGRNALCPSDARARNGSSCADLDACDGSETCIGGVCTAGVPLDCDDGDACTADACSASAGCTHTPIDGCCIEDVECDDGDPCTTDRCVASSCAHEGSLACLDAGVDAGHAPTDAGDTRADAGGDEIDGGTAPGEPEGCSCSAAGLGSRRASSTWGLAVMLVALAVARRRTARA